MKQQIKKIMKKVGMYDLIVKVKNKRYLRKCTSKKIKFENRMKDREKLCIILAGYKPYLYDVIFERIKECIEEDIDVCILSSGIYSQELSNIAKSNDWSYLSQKENSVAKVQNTAINLFKNAKYIYKLDEDVFVTKNYFSTLMKTLKECEKCGEYQVGFVGPLIPINGFGNLEILKRFNLVETYTKKFEKPLYAAGRNRMVENNPEVAKFFWGYENYLPNIDEMNEMLQNDSFSYTSCPIRFSIGAILFKRQLWDDMKMFEVKRGVGLGSDEIQICNYCMENSQAIIVSKNTVVGHLSFKNQNSTMKQYFEDNKQVFKIKDVIVKGDK